MKFAHIGKDTNKIIGWYDDTIHNNIPTPNIEAADEVWQEAINNNSNAYIDGKFVIFDFRTVEDFRKDKISKIKQNCTANEPVTILVTLSTAEEKSITFNGGDSSASAISGAIKLVLDETPDATTIKIWDIDNRNHIVSLEEALRISKYIASKYKEDMYKRNDLITQVNEATTIEEIESINW